MRTSILCLLAAAALSACASAPKVTHTDWLFGVWTAVADEDGTPADVMAFGPDNKYTNYGIGCAVNGEMIYHIYNGDIYVTSEISGKGPVALVFRPSPDKSQLVYTSPRTRNNATYARLDHNPCAR